jgi:hypothetical protein
MMATELRAEPVALSWRVKERPGYTDVEFYGEIDENADFAELRRRLRGPVTFHLAEVRRINSCGVREWVNFVRDLPGVSELTLAGCSPAIVTQLNMIYNFKGPGRVRSFLAPYVCSACGGEEDKLIDVEMAGRPLRDLPEFSCGRCGAGMEFDDLPERYLSFLNDA